MNSKCTQEEIKSSIVQSLMEYDSQTLAIALMYAHGMKEYGVDITEKWQTATSQMCALERAERNGYMNAVRDMRKKEQPFSE